MSLNPEIGNPRQVSRSADSSSERRSPPNITRLVSELSKPRDLGAIITRFDRGDSWLRDVSRLSLNERTAILDVADRRITRIPLYIWRIFEKATSGLQACMNEPEKYQPAAGWNFLKNASGFLRENMPGAAGMDECFQDKFNRDIRGFINYFSSRPEERKRAHTTVAKVVADPRYVYKIGYYLAMRSLWNERFQEQKFGGLLLEAKQQVKDMFDQWAVSYNLPQAHYNRTIEQLKRTRFSAFDHLVEGVTEYDGKSSGDYEPGTLRVEVKYEGSPRQPIPPSRDKARHSLRHEILHSISAQDNIGCGIWLPDGTGLEADESMMELLNQVAGNLPHISALSKNIISVDSPYEREVTAQLMLNMKDSASFGSLFNASFGNVRDDLEPSLRQYYARLARI